MVKLFRRLIIIVFTAAFLLFLIPRLNAYSADNITLDITIRTPSGIEHQSSLPTPRGNQVSIALNDLYPSLEFVYYVHNGEVYTNQFMEFTASGSTKVTAIYKASNTYTLTYLDTNNDIIDVIYGNQVNFVITEPFVNPSKPGFDFIGWDVPTNVTEDTIVRPLYEVSSDLVAVTINGQVMSYDYNEVVTLSPVNPNFSYWADEHGQIVSTNPNYKFSVLMSRTLNEVSNENIDIQPRIYLSNVTGIRAGYISLLGYIDHPRADVIEYGILASASENVLTILNSTKIPSTSLASTNEFLRTFEGDTYKSFRAYVILSNHTIIYSDNTYLIQLTESYTENFNVTGLTASYLDKTFNGLSGTVWEAFQARNEDIYSINGSGLMLRRASDSYLRIAFPNGLDKLSFDYRKAFTGNAPRQLEIIANGSVIHTTPVFGNFSGADSTVHTVSLSNLDLPFNSVIIIKNVGTSDTGTQTVIDNFKWTEKVEPNVTERLHQVTFNYIDSQVNRIVRSNQSVVEPILPTLDTHEFEGWYLNPNFSGDAVDMLSPISESITLYAKWNLIVDPGQVIENELYNIDFGSNNITGYEGTEITFTNNSNSTLYTLPKLRAQINTFGTNPAMILTPISTSNESYIEFDLTGFSSQVTEISFDYTAWNSTAVNNIKNTNRDALFALQVFRNGIWETLENIDGITNLKDALLDTYQTVRYLVPGNFRYRVILNTPGSGTTSTNIAQAGVIDNFIAINRYTTTSNPVFLSFGSDTVYAILGDDFEVTPPTAIDCFGRLLETSLVDITYDMDTLGIYELVYETYDFENLRSTFTLYLHVIETSIPEDLPEMDEANLVDLKARFQPQRSSLVPGFSALSEQGLLDYYAGLNGLTGASFKQALQNILISTHRRNISYDEARFVLEQSDAIMTPQGTYLDGIYSSTPIVRYWDAGETWAREHVWPNSKLGIPRVSGSSRNLGSDPHNLRAINPSVNSSRSNRYFDNGTGSFGTIGLYAYDPGLSHRGDVARIFFYMMVRYDELSLSSIISEVLAGENYTSTATTMGLLNVLIQWHLEDPVDQFEINRNNIIFSYQGNRNPFIDNPSYVQLLFS
jgi:hypothetical protein